MRRTILENLICWLIGHNAKWVDDDFRIVCSRCYACTEASMSEQVEAVLKEEVEDLRE